jgi:glycosyltransferase involved in cell wall biosynthesis
MSKQIALFWLGDPESQPPWSLGECWPVEPTPIALQQTMNRYIEHPQADAVLFWDGSLGAPSEAIILKALARPGDLWHAGLRLGMGGLPGLIDFVAPTWMLNRDPDPNIEATSWRLSLRCCLMRREVIRQMGGVHPDFRTLEGASLELGYRYIKRGVLTRHLPWFWSKSGTEREPKAEIIPFYDQLRFIFYGFGKFWSRYALMRALQSGYINLSTTVKAIKTIGQMSRPDSPAPFKRNFSYTKNNFDRARVSILIPTLDRYSYLRTLLKQLRYQIFKPLEIIIVDQTSERNRDNKLAEDFADLPLKIIFLDQPGQCSSRNAGLSMAQGDFILFLDDDDEVAPDLIAQHLNSLSQFQSDVSSGVAHDEGAGPLPEDFTYIRSSDVFPTNNTLIRLEILKKSGLFDLAYNKLSRADGDLGTRIYLSGALMVLNPNISVIHHHAPTGGLRRHKARVITYASSRRFLTHRHLPSKSEVYLAKRYFSPRQVQEDMWLRILGTFALKGLRWRQGMKILISALLSPHTWWRIRAVEKEAEDMLRIFPQIPVLPICPKEMAKG